MEDTREATNLRFYFLILCYPDLSNTGFKHEVFKQLNEIIRRIRRNKPEIFGHLVEWVASWSLETRSDILETLQKCMSMYLDINTSIDHYVAFICDPMAMLFEANQLIENEEHRIHFDKFYNRTLTRNGYLDFKLDYDGWNRGGNVNRFSFCEYPFLLDPVAKREILKIEKDENKRRAAIPNQGQLFNIGLGMPFISVNPYFVISVRRAHVLQDALQWIVRTANSNPSFFYKELKIVFDNEEGVDQGLSLHVLSSISFLEQILIHVD